MTSPGNRIANRANALASTGPRTVGGRARAAQNARKHGLSVPALSDPLLSKAADALATELAGEPANAEIREFARNAATAVLEVGRIRAARFQLLFKAMDDPEWDTHANQQAKNRAVFRCAWSAGALTPVPREVLEYVYSRPEGAEKFAMILDERRGDLFALDATNAARCPRRKFAIRALDLMKRGAWRQAGRRLGGWDRRCKDTVTQP